MQEECQYPSHQMSFWPKAGAGRPVSPGRRTGYVNKAGAHEGDHLHWSLESLHTWMGEFWLLEAGQRLGSDRHEMGLLKDSWSWNMRLKAHTADAVINWSGS